MNLLVVTQAVDVRDPILGFFHAWLLEFASRSTRVHVICLREGEHHLPHNVSVHSLGKERQAYGSQFTVYRRIRYAARFLRQISRLRREYDAVFVHMNPEYVVLGGFLWRLWNKRIVLWYVHRQRSLSLSIAALLVHRIATAAKGSIALRSERIAIVGHGIETDAFKREASVLNTKAPRLVTVGRISPIKSLETTVKAIKDLRTEGIDTSLDIVGPVIYEEDALYRVRIEKLIREEDLTRNIRFLKAIPHSQMPELYTSYDIAVNASPTGGIDKAVLEAMAAGKIVFVANESFREYLNNYASDLTFRFEDHEDLAEKVRALLARNDISSLSNDLQSLARERADIGRCISSIMRLYDDTSR